MAAETDRILRLERELESLRNELSDLRNSIAEIRNIALKGNHNPADDDNKPASPEEIQDLLNQIDKINQELKPRQEEKLTPAPLGAFLFSSLFVFVIISVFMAILNAVGIIDDSDNPYQYALLASVLLSTALVITELFSMKKSPQYGTNRRLFFSISAAIAISVGTSSYLIHELLKEFEFYSDKMIPYFIWIPIAAIALLIFLAFRFKTELRESGSYTPPSQ